jgi:hypothetical protein
MLPIQAQALKCNDCDERKPMLYRRVPSFDNRRFFLGLDRNRYVLCELRTGCVISSAGDLIGVEIVQQFDAAALCCFPWIPMFTPAESAGEEHYLRIIPLRLALLGSSLGLDRQRNSCKLCKLGNNGAPNFGLRLPHQ